MPFSWLPLNDLKGSNPVEVAAHTKTRDIDGDPTFARWVLNTFKKIDAIISCSTIRDRKTSHKCDIEVPVSAGHSHDIYR